MKTIKNYKILEYPASFFDYFIEIGADQGDIAHFMCERDPDLKVICYEPCLINYNKVCEKLEKYNNAIYVNKALGTGDPLFFCDKKTSCCQMFSSTPSDSYSIESVRLGDIIMENNIDIDRPFEMVIDCEGGEWSMVGDAQAENILKKCTHLGLEVHFYKEDAICDKFNSLGRWEDIHKWICETFSSTHKIKYSREGRRLGVRTYVIHKIL